jgi:hypothetical protein
MEYVPPARKTEIMSDETIVSTLEHTASQLMKQGNKSMGQNMSNDHIAPPIRSPLNARYRPIMGLSEQTTAPQHLTIMFVDEGATIMPMD